MGYYYRKFNKLAAKGKPGVFPGRSGSSGTLTSYTQNSSLMSKLEERIVQSVTRGDWEGFYYRLSSFKLLKELGLLTIEGQVNFLSFLEFWLGCKKSEADLDQLEEIMHAMKK